MCAKQAVSAGFTISRGLLAISVFVLLGGGWLIWRSFNPPPVEKRFQNYPEIRLAHRELSEHIVVKPPFQIVDCRVEEAPSGTRLILPLQSLNPEAIAQIDQSVYVISIHTNNYLIVYTHNSGALWFRNPALPKDDTLLVMDGSYRIVAQGRLLFEHNQKRIVVEIPLRLTPRDIALVRLRYLPSAKQARRIPKGADPSAYLPAVSTVRFSHPKERRVRERRFP